MRHFGKPLVAILALGLAASMLSGCQMKPVTSGQGNDHQQKAGDIPNMAKSFSAPNLGILLSSLKIRGEATEIWGQEITGTARLADEQAQDIIKSEEFAPAQCQDLLLGTYKDSSGIPAAFSHWKAKAPEIAIVRTQLRSQPSVESAQAVIDAQLKLAKECPKFGVKAPGAKPITMSVVTSPYPLEGASSPTLVTSTSTSEDSLVTQQVGVFARVGNLDLRIYFDSVKAPEAFAKEEKGEIQAFVTFLGKSLVAKGKD